jgi:lysyl-tRNA synthetase class 2
MDLTEKLFRGIAVDVCGSTTIHYQGDDFDFSKAFNRISVFDSILEYNPTFTADDLSEANATATAKKLGIDVKDNWGLGKNPN